MAARKYDAKKYIDFPHSPPEVKQLNHDQFNKQKKKYDGVEGGSYQVGIGGDKFVTLLVAYTPNGASQYISTEVNGSGLDELYRLYPGGVAWATFMQEAEDVFYEAPQPADPKAPASTRYGPPNFLDQMTFTKSKIDELGVKFLSHNDYKEKKEAAKFAIAHSGKFLLRLYKTVENEQGWLLSCSYTVFTIASKKGGEYSYYATEKEDDPKEMGRYFYERENFPSGAVGELAFQTYTATQPDFWQWEAKVAADKAAAAAAAVGNAALEAATAAAAAAAKAAEDALKKLEEESAKLLGNLLELLFSDPLILALILGGGYLAYLYVSH